MQFKAVFRLLGLLLIIFSISMLTPLIINLIFKESDYMPFITAFICTFCSGALLRCAFRHHQQNLKIRDGFLLVVLFWFVLCLFGAIPFFFTLGNNSLFTNAIFEAVAGFTTTGASVITHLDGLPHAILYYRQQLQFIGGMGIVVLAVAILPMLGVGGMQLYRAETPGPMKNSKLTPRIAHTAKALWYIYFLLTLLCAICYWAAGMDWFNALGESFATVSTGGFSMHDGSFTYYHSEAILLIACIFMLLSGVNFSLHFLAFKQRSLKSYWQDDEFRSYMLILGVACIVVTTSLVLHGYYPATPHTLLQSVFCVISMSTSTGFVSSQFSTWPTFIPLLMMLLGIVGGCAASTSGGIKVLRALLIFKQSKREMARLLHPNAVIPIKFGNQTLAEPILQSMWGFISIFIALFFLLMLIFMALGNDFLTAFSAIASTLANGGTGLGTVTHTFAHLNLQSKWVLIFSMLAGRLEIFSLLILFSKQFWER